MASFPGSNWPQQRVKLMQVHQENKIDDNTVDTGLLAVYIRAVGLDCSKQFYVGAIAELDPEGTQRITFSRLVRWFKSQCAAQDNDRRFNRLLVKPTVGHATQPTYNLPAGAHIYGKPISRDPVGAKESIFSAPPERPRRRQQEKYLDALEMNKRAVAQGLTTARQFNSKWSQDRIYRSKKRQHHHSYNSRRQHEDEAKSVQFGYIKPEERASMNSLVAGEFYNRDDTEIYPKHTGREKVRNQRRLLARRLNLVKHTKKSYGALTARAREAELLTQRSTVDNFRLKKFSNVKPRVNMTGHVPLSRVRLRNILQS